MYVCPCIIYEIDERYLLDATIYLLFNCAILCMCVRASYMKLTRDTYLMQQFIYYYKQLYMFRASGHHME